MKTMTQYVHDATGMTLTAGWRECFIPEIRAYREDMLGQLVYSELDDKELRALRRSIHVLDNILSFEERLAEMAKGMKDNPQDAGNVVQSSTEAVV